MVVSGGGFWSSWCSGWTHSVWLQTDIFDSFRELFVNNYRWLLLLSTVSVILIDQLPAASIAPSRGPWRSSRTDRSLFTRSRYTRSGPVPQNKTFECVTLDSKDLSYQVIDQKQWTDEQNNRCVNSSSSLTQFMLLWSLTVLDRRGFSALLKGTEYNVGCSVCRMTLNIWNTWCEAVEDLDQTE